MEEKDELQKTFNEIGQVENGYFVHKLCLYHLLCFFKIFFQSVIENNKFFEQYEVTYQILKKAAEIYAKASGSRK